MDAYIFQAALLCADCATSFMAKNKQPEHIVEFAPGELDESSYDSDEWPKGPYGEGGGESDTPAHCDHCQAFLDNSLTGDGETYVRDAFREYVETGRGSLDVLSEWKAGYDWVWSDFESITYADMLDDGKVHGNMVVRYNQLEQA